MGLCRNWGFFRGQSVCLVLLCLVPLSALGCTNVDATLLDPSSLGDGDGDGDGTMPGDGDGDGDGDMPGDGDGDGDMPGDGDGDGDMPGDGDGDGDGGGGGCQPNPGDAQCPMICPETCNGDDDDCDGKTDEGAPDEVCNIPNAGAVCASGACVVVQCDNGFRDCDAQADNGCEVDGSDPNNCGACGTVCALTNAVATCVDDVCAVSECEEGFGDCDDEPLDCETSLDALDNCGGCGVPCTDALNAATPSCATGVCGPGECDPGFGDCNGLPGDGCEQRLDTLDHCGTCDTVCNLAGCPGGVCSAVACSPPEADCDGDGVTCEIDLSTDVDHCGSCNAPCGFGMGVDPQADITGCSAQQCQIACHAGFGNCNGQYEDGCEQALNTVGDCGGCGVTCSRPGGTASCATGTCELSDCDMGFDNCDGNDANGCEQLNSLDHCGACDQPCLITNGTGDCSSGSCELDSCGGDWADCDGDPANGCEQQLSVLGPCDPDTNCRKVTWNLQTYFICDNARTWADAQAQCRQQLSGDLIRIDSQEENDFLAGEVGASYWIGASDAANEGDWRWADNGLPFWTGDAGGTDVGGAYNSWNGGEPNDSGGEDCAELQTTGGWNDLTCDDTKGFVCEIQQDLCPDDPDKAHPGQCGCGNADTDDDGDGTANCNDACPGDGNKTAPGQCGCGVSDADGDQDGIADCNDPCPAGGDTDADGTQDCIDGCPYDPAATMGACGYGYDAVNIDEGGLDLGGAPETVLDCGTVTIDSSGGVTLTNWCGTAPVPVVTTQTSGTGPEVVIIPLRSLSLPAGNTLKLVGSRPIILAVGGDADIRGTINASATNAVPGAGGNVSCGAGKGSNGTSDGDGDDGGGGGGGGAFSSTGGSGGGGNGGGGGGGGGATEGNGSLVPLRGGCAGGKGGNGHPSNDVGRQGGAGGGAVQLSVGGLLSVGSSAVIAAAGGGGSKGGNHEDGGGGGGSGGAVLLEGAVVDIHASAWVTAHGGGGASGNPSDSTGGASGADGIKNALSQAPGGNGEAPAGDGGKGAIRGSGAANGGDGGRSCTLIFLCGPAGAGGGAGGGGRGRVRINGDLGCAGTGSGQISPSPSLGCP